jgi:Leucine-rich repeat (LRR) protein
MESTASPMTQIPTGAPVGTPEAPTFAPTSEVLRKRPSTPEYAFNYNNTASAGVSEYVRIRDVIVSASPSSTMAIANENSTQSRALDWLYVSDPSGLSDLRLVQRWVLASFYYATDGDRWVINQGWMQPGEECDWYGVTCHNGMIGRLELIQNRLIGDIVPEISTLKSMYLLSLGNDFDASEEDKNQFIIPLPSFLGDMTNLALLNLAGVGLTSTIPEELFTSWAQLESLFLNDNDITGTLPKSIEHLRSIEVLWLGGNNLGGSIVSEIGQLASLRELSLESNFRANVIGKRGFITNIPAEIGQLTSLETLNLADNALSGLVPMALGNLVSLRGLQLSGNFFEGQLPPTLGRLEMLEELDISFNWCVRYYVVNLLHFMPN